MKLPGCVIYDNGGETFDRYTIVNPTPWNCRGQSVYIYAGSSENPFHPQGFGQHGETVGHRVDKPGSQHLGRKVKDHSKLPDAVRRFACTVCETAEQLELFQ